MSWPLIPPHLVDPYPWSRRDGRLARLPRDVVGCIIRPMVLYSNRWRRLASILQRMDGSMVQFVIIGGIGFLFLAHHSEPQPITFSEDPGTAHYLGQIGTNYIFQIPNKIVTLDRNFERCQTLKIVPDLQPLEARLVGSTVVAAGRIICEFFAQRHQKTD